MKFSIAIASLGLLFLSSCTQDLVNFNQKKPAQEGDTIFVDYIGKFPDGTVFDTSIIEEAKKANKFSESRTYSPLEVVIGERKVVSGFEKALIGAIEGQSKPGVVVPPSEGYGDAKIRQVIPLEKITSPIEQSVPAKYLQAKFEENIPLALLEEAKQPTEVGKTFTLTGSDQMVTQGKIIAIKEGNAQALLDNPLAPFGDKKIVPGLVGKSGYARITALSLSGSEIKIKIEPFFHATLKEGEELSIPGSESFTVGKKTENDLEIFVKNNHPLAGKTLIFDLFIRKVVSKNENKNGDK